MPYVFQEALELTRLGFFVRASCWIDPKGNLPFQTTA